MRFARSHHGLRILACLLIVSMLPALIVPTGRAASTALHSSFEGWIRAQLLSPADEVVNRALDAAADENPRTFEAFVAAFLEAYEDERPDLPAARAFTERDLSDDALISYLQRRYTEIAGEAVLPRLRLVAAGPVLSLASGGATGLPVRGDTLLPITLDAQAAVASPVVVTSSVELNPARPQGP